MRRMGMGTLALAAAMAAVMGVSVSAGAGGADKLKKQIDDIKSRTFVSLRSSEWASRYIVKRSADSLLEQHEWFRLWSNASEDFRQNVEEKLRVEKLENDYRATLNVRSLDLEDWGSLSVQTPFTDASLYLEDVFVSPLPPSEDLFVPEGDYKVTVRTKDLEAVREAHVGTGEETSVTLTRQDFGPASPAEEELGKNVEWPTWWRKVTSRGLPRLFPYGEGIAVSTLEKERRLTAYSTLSGCLLWEKELSPAPLSPLVKAGNFLLWGGSDSAMHILDLKKGEERPTLWLGGRMEVAPVVTEDLIIAFVAKGGKGIVIALERGTYKKRWSAETGLQPMALQGFGGAVLASGKTSKGGRDRILALDLQGGTETWSRYIGDREEMILAGQGSDLLFWDGRKKSSPVFLDPKSGEETAPLIIEGKARIVRAVVTEGRALLITSDDRFLQVDIAERTVTWSRDLPKGSFAKTKIMAVGGKNIILFARDSAGGGEWGMGLLMVRSRRTGRLSYSRKVVLLGDAQPLGDSRILIPDGRGICMIEDLERGYTPWRFETTLGGPGGEKMTAAPGVGNRLYLYSTARSRLYSFRLP